MGFDLDAGFGQDDNGKVVAKPPVKVKTGAELAMPAFPPNKKEAALSPGGVKEAAQFSAQQISSAFWESVGKYGNAGLELVRNGIPSPLNYLKAYLKIGLPPGEVDTLFGAYEDGVRRMVGDEARTPEEFVKRYTPKKGDFSKELKDRFVGEEMEAPGAFSKYLFGPMSRGVGAFAAAPVPGAAVMKSEFVAPLEMSLKGLLAQKNALGKNLVMAAGGGEGGDLGAKAGGAIGRAVGHEETGEELGAIGGGALGGAVNVPRANAMGKGWTAGTAGVKATWNTPFKDPTDARGYFMRLADNYKGFSPQLKGYFDERVAEQLIDAASKTPNARENVAAVRRMAADAGIDPKVLTPGQQTLAPILVEKEAYFDPASPEQATGRETQRGKLRTSIIKAYERLTGLSHEADHVETSAKLAYKHFLDEQAARGKEAAVVMDQTPRMDPTQLESNGAKVKEVFDGEHKAASDKFNQLYTGTYRAADSAGVTVNTTAATKKALIELGSVEVGMNPKASYNLQHAVDVVEGKFDQLTFQQAHKITSALFKEAKSAKAADDTVRASHLNKYRTDLLEDMKKSTYGTEEKPGKARYVWQQFEGIQQAYREKFIPRFETGINYKLDREAGRTNNNNDFLKDSDVFGKGYLTTDSNKQVPESNMVQFDNAFGGKVEGTKRDERAYQALAKDLSNRYAQEVYDTKGKADSRSFNESDHAGFMRKYQAALARTPQLAEQFEASARRLTEIKNRAELSAKRWKFIHGKDNPFNALNEGEVYTMFSKALAEPQKMGHLIRMVGPENAKTLFQDMMARNAPWKEGNNGGMEYHPDKLLEMVNAGISKDGRMGSLQLLSRAAWGKELGDRHYNNLKNIAGITVREAVTDPRFAGSESLSQLNLVGDMSGQSAASWVSAWKSMKEGRTSTAWFGTQAVTRLMRTHLEKAMQAAEYRALFDPTYSEAISELMVKKPSERITYKTAKALGDTIGKDGSALVKELVNHGYVKSSAGTGAAIGELSREKKKKDEE